MLTVARCRVTINVNDNAGRTRASSDLNACFKRDVIICTLYDNALRFIRKLIKPFCIIMQNSFSFHTTRETCAYISPRNQNKFIKRFTQMRGPSRASKSITGSIRSTSIQTKISKNPAMPEKADNCYAIFRALAISSRKFARRSIIHPCTRDILVSLMDICPFGDTLARRFSADSIRCTSLVLSKPGPAPDPDPPLAH